MCLVKVKQEEDVVVPYRVVQQRPYTSPRRRVSHTSTRRYSRPEIVRERESPRPSASYVAVPTPPPLQIPPPQPMPVFIEPPPPPPIFYEPVPPRSTYEPVPPRSTYEPVPPRSAYEPSSPRSYHGQPQYVEVSPRSSVTSRSSSPTRSDYVYHEREVRRERAERVPGYEHYRYVEAAPSESDYYPRSQRGRSRGYEETSRGRGYDEMSRERSMSRGYERGYRETTTTRASAVDDDVDGMRNRYRR